MPGQTTPPADGQQGDGGTSSPADPPAKPEPAKTFTQAELDTIVQDRVRRESAKFEDYSDLKAKAARLDEAEEASKTELQKITDRATTAETAVETANARVDRIIRQSAITAEAASQGAADAETVVALLAADDSITIDGDVVKGAKSAVKKLLEAKPFLKGKNAPPDSSGPAFSGQQSNTDAEKLAEATKAGDTREMIRLKTAKLFPGG